MVEWMRSGSTGTGRTGRDGNAYHPNPNLPWPRFRSVAYSPSLHLCLPSNIPFAWFLVLGCNRQAWVVESQQGN